MKCIDIHQTLKGIGRWVDWEHTVDSFKAGDSQRKVMRVAVSWKASRTALEQAVNFGADLFITHESIAVEAVNESSEQDSYFALKSEIPLFEWLDSTGMVVYRCHDFWDQFPVRGVRDSWASGLLGDAEIVEDVYPYLVMKVEPMSIKDLTHKLLSKIQPLGENGVLVTGDGNAVVSKVGLGTGAATDPLRMIALGAEVGIVTDDYHLFVRTGEHVQDLGFPTITVNHGVSEEWGIRNLTAYIESQFPELETLFIPHPCIYQCISK
jgi:putative NIF3 family GTP cyclohydrolase 1 type 2